MEPKDKNEFQASDQPEFPPFDDIRNLYIGPIENATGFIVTDLPDQEPLPIIIWGEVLLYGHSEDEVFVVERLRRVAFYGALEKPESDPRIGVFSLAGPLEEPALEPGPTGFSEGVVQQLHYAALSSELEPLIKSYDAVFPQVEQIAAKFTWEQQGKPDETAVQLNISFVANKLVDKKLGFVQKFILDPITLNFFLAGTGAPSPEPRHSLQSNCPTPPAGTCPAYQQTYTRSLSLKFINFTRQRINPGDPGYYAADVEAFCNTQIQGLCDVWRNKAALQFVVQNILISADPVDRNAYYNADPTEEASIATIMVGPGFLKYDSVNQIEVYIIENFVPSSHGGAITHNNGQASAYCILAIGQAGGNAYLLAHEMGHVLGLAHPFGTPDFENSGLMDSSPESIMKPGNPNPTTNTVFNCRILLPPPTSPSPPSLWPQTLDCMVLSPQPPLNSIVSSPGANDCFRPDIVDHFIRDFPTDVGNEPSVPPAGQNVWNNSNVWNRRSNTPGGLNPTGGPLHEEPFVCSDPQKNFINYMWVKLEQLTNLSDPVAVDLYLAVPGASTNLIPLNPPTPSSSANHRLNFCPPPTPTNPVTQSLAWIVPAGYTAHSCVFAISYSADAPSPILNPASMNFGNVAPLVTGHNCIAQRNLNIQVTTCMNPRACTTTLAWVHIDNPFDKAAPARLEIDATQAARLSNLFLEVDDRIVGEITLGEISTIQIADLLQPGESRVLRFQATLPPVMLPHGTELPIHLRCIVDDQFINGYTHIVRVAPIETTVVQVFDILFSALRDVGVGYKSEFGQMVADKVRKIVIRERQIAKSSGCLSLLWRIFWPKSIWRVEGANLTQEISAVAQSLPDTGAPQDEVVRRRLYELAGLLLSPKDTPAPIFIERIRDLADRIQEPAGRLARQQVRA